MKKRTFVAVLGVAAGAALLTGGILASNMGFKLNYTLQATLAGVSNSGLNTLALPDFRQSGLDSASQLMTDVGLVNVTNLQKLIISNDTLQVYTGRKGSPGADFALNAGEGYLVKMATTVNYIVVGSDNPSLASTLQAPQVGVSNSGLNLFAYNYHETSASASALMNEIGLANVTNTEKLIISNDTLQVYTGRKGSPGADFPLTPGQAYFVKMATTVNFTPNHY